MPTPQEFQKIVKAKSRPISLKGFHFEKLKGRKGERTLRLNKQWRLIVFVDEDEDGSFLLIIDIEDYH